jgi:predicted flavoprotein YhiN
MHYDLAILGAGAAGMMAAVAAAEQTLDPATGKSRLRIAIFEKNTQPGVKVLVCGGGRCNFTNAGSVDFLIEQFGRNGRFLTPALRHLDNDGLRDWFASQNVPSHEEHDGKIYPDSNQAKSIVNALVTRMRTLGVEIFTGPAGTITHVYRTGGNETTEDTESTEKKNTNPFSVPSVSSVVNFGLTTANNDAHTAHTLLLAVGGMSYQRMGTTGDGYTFAQSLGHSIVTPRPAIVALLVKEEWVKELQGLAVEEVEVKILVTGTLPTLATGRPTPTINDLLFTHFGLSGPAILNPSEIVAELLEKFDTITLRIDFAHHLAYEEVAATLRAWQQHEGKKLIRKMLALPSMNNEQSKMKNKNSLSLPTRLAEKFCELEQIPPEQSCSTLTAAQIHRLTERLKNSRFTVHATRGFKEAMVTAGGIKLSEVDPRTLESKITPHLFLTGEVLDLTGPSGGYNLQLAFSTGHLAGTTIGQRAMEMGQGDNVTR